MTALSPKSNRVFACTTKGSVGYATVQFKAGDTLLFGPETRGLPDQVLTDSRVTERLRIPMKADSRSLNLSNSVAIIAFEAWRQVGFGDAE